MKQSLNRAIIAGLVLVASVSGAARRGAGQTLAAGAHESLGTTFSIRSQLVQIYATVAGGSERVAGLTAADFALEEDGKAQKIDKVETGNVPLQIALLLDTSESMRDALPEVQEAAAFFVQTLKPQDRVTLIPFSSDIRSVSQETDDQSAVLAAISRLKASGSTRLYDALLFATKQLSGKEGRKAIVTFSDGEDTGRGASLNVVLNAAARFGYPVYTIASGFGTTKEQLKKVLREIADVNSARMFYLESASGLKQIFAEISSELRTAYVVSYYTAVPFDGSWHDLLLKPVNQRVKVNARRGFFAKSGVSTGLMTSLELPRQLARAADHRPSPPVVDRGAQIAFRELTAAPVPPREIDPTLIKRETPSAPADTPGQERAVFKVESRFVEVPVLLESAAGQNLHDLSERDFRIYEDGTLRDIAFFRRGIRQEDLPSVRESALKSTRTGSVSPALADASEMALGRTYLVIDDMSSEAGAFLGARKAAEQIIRQYHTALRPISLHLTSEGQADITADQTADQMINRLKRAGLRSDRELTSNDGIMSIYEAYLIERGDEDARQLVELRYASQQHYHYRNGLGEVDGIEIADPTTIRSAVEDLCRRLLAQNNMQITRTIDGLSAVVGAASADASPYPKTVLLFSSGFSMGRSSMRSDMTSAFDRVAKTAKEHRVRFITVSSSGLETGETIGIGASPAFLFRNPQLSGILNAHNSDWRFDRENPLSQLAHETGGRFVHNTNDLAGAAAAALGSTGQLYYLGFLSNQPVDGKFHRIRVVCSAPARVHTRKGYFAGHRAEPASGAGGGEDLETLLSRSEAARRAGDVPGFAESLKALVRKVPDNADLWFNLGSALTALKDPEGAMEALQRAFALAPEDMSVGMALSRALVAAGYRDAAVDTLRDMLYRHPRSIELLVEKGRVLEADARFQDAFQSYRSVLDITSSPPLDVYVLLARTSMRLGRRTEARLFIHDYLARGGTETTVEPWRRELGGSQ
jgi:Ca-activated chloride channel homolog